MARRGGRDLAVGAMFALALVVVALAIMAVGGDSGLFFKRIEYSIVFPSADGLLFGAPVKMSGVKIGTVSSVELPTDPLTSGINVAISVDPVYAGRIQTDSRSALRILQLLTNEKYVDLTAGQSGELLPPGSQIPVIKETGAENLSDITVSLKTILGRLESGQGLLGQMLQDPEFGKAGMEALGRTMENMEQLSANLKQGRGAVGRLLADEQLAAKLDTLGAAIDAFAVLMERLSRGDGAFGALLTEDGPGEQAIGDLGESVAALRRITERLESDQGLLGRLLNDPEYSEALADDLGSALANIAEITAKINRGEGTLGAILNDRALYDGADDLVAGTNDSKFARWMLRHYRKKGIEAQEAAADEAAAAQKESEVP